MQKWKLGICRGGRWKKLSAEMEAGNLQRSAMEEAFYRNGDWESAEECDGRSSLQKWKPGVCRGALVNKFWTQKVEKLITYGAGLYKPYATPDIAQRNAGQLMPTV